MPVELHQRFPPPVLEPQLSSSSCHSLLSSLATLSQSSPAAERFFLQTCLSTRWEEVSPRPQWNLPSLQPVFPRLLPICSQVSCPSNQPTQSTRHLRSFPEARWAPQHSH